MFRGGRSKKTIFAGAACGVFFRFSLAALLFSLVFVPAARAQNNTELGAEDDFTVLGIDGVAADPDAEIRGFTVFGATQTAYPGIAAGPGNVAVNGFLSVSSGAYFAKTATFTALGNIFVNDGTSGYYVRKNTGGWLEWGTPDSIGDSLGLHVASQTLNMAGFNLVNASSINYLSNVYLTSAPAAQYGGLYVSTHVYTPGSVYAFKYYGDGSALAGLPQGDSLGTHVATQALNMNGFGVFNAGGLTSNGQATVYSSATILGLTGVKDLYAAGISSFTSSVYFTGVSSYSSVANVHYAGGNPGQVLTKVEGGGMQWSTPSSLVSGDSLGSHVATKTLDMAGFAITGVSTVTVSSITTTAAGLTVSTHLYVMNGDLGVGTSQPRARADVTGNELRLGPVGYPASYSVTNSGYLVIDKSGTAGDASIVFRDQGNARAEIGIVTDNDIHFKTVTGSYGSETFTDRLLIRGTGEVDAFGLLRSYATSGVARVFAGNSDGATAGAALELSYDFGSSLSRITSIERGNVYRDLLVEGNNLRFQTGSAALAEAMRVTTEGTVGIGNTLPLARLDVVSTGTASNIYAQVWRNGAGVVVASMTSQGILHATLAPGVGDNMGNHTATRDLDLAQFGISNVSTISATGLYISGYGVIQTTGTGLGGVAVNPRGTGAVDLQTYRTATSQVASGDYSFIGSGRENTTDADYAFIGAGYNNTVWAFGGVIGGGRNNSSEGMYSAVGGGYGNTAGQGAWGDTVAGGESNTAMGGASAIGGGYLNIINNYSESVIAGGSYNGISASYAAIGGGTGNSVTGNYGVVPGGSYNTAKGAYSFAAGRGSSSTASGAFTWSDSNVWVETVNNVPNRTWFKNIGGFLVTGSTNPAMTGLLDRGMLVTGAGRVGISTGTPGAALDVVADGSAATDFAQIWRNASGVEVASMSATGVLYATLPPGTGDDLGNHTATADLNMAVHSVVGVTSATMVGKGLQIGTDLTASASGVFISTSGQIMTLGLGNGTAAPGARGHGAVDLQNYRTNASSVAAGAYSVVGGGRNNRAAGPDSVVAGGLNNTAAAGDYNTVSGGSGNRASGAWAATIAGGDTNSALGAASTVSGGLENAVADYYSVVAGGYRNTATLEGASVSGGTNNSADGYYSAVLGGSYNWAIGDYSVVAGVSNLAVQNESAALGGSDNIAGGFASVVLGGENNVAGGNYSFAAGLKSSSTAEGSFTWSDAEGTYNYNSVANRTVFKNRGGFLVTGSTNPAMTGLLDRGMLVTGAGRVGISTGTPGAALDVVADGSAATDFAQIWRNASGVEVASMSATGVLYATLPPGTGDDLGNHTATQNLNLNTFNIVNASSATFSQAVTVYSSVTVAGSAFSVGGSTLTVNSGKVGVGLDNPTYKFEVKDNATTFQVNPQGGYVSLLVGGVEVARMKP